MPCPPARAPVRAAPPSQRRWPPAPQPRHGLRLACACWLKATNASSSRNEMSIRMSTPKMLSRGDGPVSHRAYVILYGWGVGCARHWLRRGSSRAARRTPSREAAKEYSPGRKPWVVNAKRHSPEGAKETHASHCRKISQPSTAPFARGGHPPHFRPATRDSVQRLTAGNPQALEGSVWLDLFAGTGAVGIEAISRGAAMVYFVESDKPAAELVRQNLQSLGITKGFQIMQQKSAKAIAQLDRQQIRPDYIFLDPPYAARDAYQQTLEMLSAANYQRAL